ncbi:igLON family member 5-like [Littorina saxatilis]|uniref:igLON family member 5-like n=1 Tax=Littorina saxatilis TaxID=31220 RepID=UPI0038B68874
MNNTDKEITVNGADRATLNVVCEAFGRPKPEQFNMTTPDRGSYFINVTETGKWTKQAAVTLSDIQCRDMGTYSCTAHNGLGHPDTRSITLNVRCPPKKTFNKTLKMTESGIGFTLEAFPAPDKFAFTYLGKDTRSKGTSVLSDFHSTCQQDRVKAYMVQCVIIPVNVPKRLLGLYRVDVSNGIGSVEVAFQIRIEDKAIVKSLTMNNTDKEITVTGSDHATLNMVCEAFGRHTPPTLGLQKVGKETSLAGVTVTETGKWTKQAAVTLSDIQCRDMGTYSCTAHNGLGHPDTRSIMLNVRCE